MIEFIISECKSVMQGTTHENDWYFYHNALSLMTAAATLKWMREKTVNGQKSYYQKWLIPQLGLNKGTIYEGRSVEKSPKCMPLDNSFNADVTRLHDHPYRATPKLH